MTRRLVPHRRLPQMERRDEFVAAKRRRLPDEARQGERPGGTPAVAGRRLHRRLHRAHVARFDCETRQHRDAILLRAMVPLEPATAADLSGRDVLLAAGFALGVYLLPIIAMGNFAAGLTSRVIDPVSLQTYQV